MRATAETIWAVPAYLPYVQPALTDSAIVEAERMIGYPLPEEYLDLLRRQNGGSIRFTLPDFDAEHRVIAGIGPRFPSLTDVDWDESAEYVSFPLHGLVPFDGDGHWHLCLDYRENPTAPSVTYVDIECDTQSAVADSFAAYLSMLRIDVQDRFVVEVAPATLAAKLDRLLGVSFEPPDSWAHGYPVRRACCGSDDTPECIWISPNRVPVGFVRDDDPRFEELKDRVNGESDRFPGLPDGASILDATEGVRGQVLEACSRAGLLVRALREYLDQ